MFSLSHYIALAIAAAPASAVLACIIISAWDEHREQNGGNRFRPSQWHRKGRTAATQHRTRR